MISNQDVPLREEQEEATERGSEDVREEATEKGADEGGQGGRRKEER